jgi:hypothetical protein
VKRNSKVSYFPYHEAKCFSWKILCKSSVVVLDPVVSHYDHQSIRDSRVRWRDNGGCHMTHLWMVGSLFYDSSSVTRLYRVDERMISE